MRLRKPYTQEVFVAYRDEGLFAYSYDKSTFLEYLKYYFDYYPNKCLMIERKLGKKACEQMTRLEYAQYQILETELGTLRVREYVAYKQAFQRLYEKTCEQTEFQDGGVPCSYDEFLTYLGEKVIQREIWQTGFTAVEEMELLELPNHQFDNWS